MIDDALLAILACPACQGDVKLLDVSSSSFIVCAKCGRRYPIKNGIPVLLADLPAGRQVKVEKPAQ